MIRSIVGSDYDEIKRIHELHYKSEFSMPDFVKNFQSATVIEDSLGIISVCGVREIAEIIAITDKSRSVRTRRKALMQHLDIATYVASKLNHDQIHAFVQNVIWEKHLTKVGFHPAKGKALVLEI